MKRLVGLISISVIVFGCSLWPQPPADNNDQQNANQVVENQPKAPKKQSFATLIDVTGGESQGNAYNTYEKSIFVHKVSAGLPAPSGTDFYEGWLVKPGSKELISTGRLELNKNNYSLEFRSEKDYADYKLVVITLEPDDGDPAPAAHILEGSFPG